MAPAISSATRGEGEARGTSPVSGAAVETNERVTEEKVRAVVKKMFVDESTFTDQLKAKVAGQNQILQKIFANQDPYPFTSILSRLFGGTMPS